MDILYYIGSGSHHNNQELRYSLRSLEKHCHDVDDVWVVGNRPHFLNNNVKYLWVPDSGFWWQNAFCKTMAAIEAGISENFLLMNDDFFMLKDFSAAEYPYFHRGEIKDVAENKYQQVICNTRQILQRLGKPFKHYGVHCPMRLNAEKYRELAGYFNDVENPVSARCLYGNLFCKGCKVADCKSDEIKASATGCWSSKNWVTGEMFAELDKLFPQPSKWENEDE